MMSLFMQGALVGGVAFLVVGFFIGCSLCLTLQSRRDEEYVLLKQLYSAIERYRVQRLNKYDTDDCWRIVENYMRTYRVFGGGH